MNLGMSSRLHKLWGGGEMGSSGYIFAELALLHPSLSLSQLTAGASRTVKPWPQIIVGEHPRPSLVSQLEFWGLDFSVAKETSIPWKENQHRCFGC